MSRTIFGRKDGLSCGTRKLEENASGYSLPKPAYGVDAKTIFTTVSPSTMPWMIDGIWGWVEAVRVSYARDSCLDIADEGKQKKKSRLGSPPRTRATNKSLSKYPLDGFTPLSCFTNERYEKFELNLKFLRSNFAFEMFPLNLLPFHKVGTPFGTCNIY
ncbi:hypothetical protein KPH14_012419 [Odynerus spinipes]|uniref:Uncharacterized protein n=1 Tax=Odynerus spinipes TaxID=1348599 RepID=A0AAD9RJ96_9HYME|nr:hypothetical protein KPH14_012419 [Odynerus spinipes]